MSCKAVVVLLYMPLLALLSAAIVRAMIGLGAIDHPGARSSHSVPTPKGGGVGIVAAFAVGVALNHGPAPARLWAGLTAAALLIAAVSYTDDLRNWPPAVKLGAQLAAALMAIACGFVLGVVHLPWLGAVGLGWWGVPLTAGWILFVTNAVNFIDGLNGLASGVVAIACLFLAGSVAVSGSFLLPAGCLALAAGIAGFLPFNFPRARIFMGDVGSQPCGFAIAVLGILASCGSPQPSSLLLVPMLLSGILFDVAFTLVRRAANGDRLTQAHRSHLYQIANRAGVPAWQVTLVHWAMTVWGGLACLALAAATPAWKALPVAGLLLTQILWLGFVVGKARRANMGNWS